MKLSIAIVHAPFSSWRRANVISIKRALNMRDHPEHSLIIESDPGRSRSAWAVAAQAWRKCLVSSSGASHHLVMQDDVELCNNFLNGVERVVQAMPQEAISLYGNRKDFDVAKLEVRHWIGYKDPCWGVAVILPAEVTRDWLAWNNKYIKPEYPHDDVRLAAFLLFNDKRMWCPAPSLVEHLGAGKSLLSHKTPIVNRARWYIGSADPTAIDWVAALKNPIITSGTSWETFYTKNQEIFKARPEKGNV